MKGPPGKKGEQPKPPSLLKTPESQRCQSVLFETPLALWMRRQKRRCVICSAIVTNKNLGGHDNPSALSGSLYCIQCADGKERRGA
jgi:hypothetical protein